MQNTATRGVLAERKWVIFRKHYEHHDVPLEEIGELSGVQMKNLQKRVKDEGWQVLSRAARLQRKLAKIADTCLDHLADGEGDRAESKAKALQTISSTLVAMARSEEMIAQTKAAKVEKKDRVGNADDNIALDADGMRTLDSELQQLVARVESDRRAVEDKGA